MGCRIAWAFTAITPVFDGAREEEIKAELARAWLVDRAWREITLRTWAWLEAERERESGAELQFEDDNEAASHISCSGCLADDAVGSIVPASDFERLASDMLQGELDYARDLVARGWLEEKGYDSSEVFASALTGDDAGAAGYEIT